VGGRSDNDDNHGPNSEELVGLLYQRDAAIEEWDTEETVHIRAVEKMKKAMEYANEENADLAAALSMAPQTPRVEVDSTRGERYDDIRAKGTMTKSVSDLIASGMNMILSKTLSERIGPSSVLTSDKGANENIKEELGTVAAAAATTTSSSDDDDDGNLPVASFALLLIAIFPGLVGLVVIVMLVVLGSSAIVNMRVHKMSNPGDQNPWYYSPQRWDARTTTSAHNQGAASNWTRMTQSFTGGPVTRSPYERYHHNQSLAVYQMQQQQQSRPPPSHPVHYVIPRSMGNAKQQQQQQRSIPAHHHHGNFHNVG